MPRAKKSNKPSTTDVPPRYKRFAAAIAQGKSKREAALEAGASTPVAADQFGHRLSKNVRVQQLIAQALETHEATPEFAVGRLKKIAEQDEELGASRLAAKDILELHGWHKNEPNSPSLVIRNAFFQGKRDSTDATQTPVAGTTPIIDQ